MKEKSTTAVLMRFVITPKDRTTAHVNQDMKETGIIAIFACHRLVTSAERELKDSRIRDAQAPFKVAFGCPKVASKLVRDIVEFFDLFLF